MFTFLGYSPETVVT